jgi:hypothetical protein
MTITFITNGFPQFLSPMKSVLLPLIVAHVVVQEHKEVHNSRLVRLFVKALQSTSNSLQYYNFDVAVDRAVDECAGFGCVIVAVN